MTPERDRTVSGVGLVLVGILSAQAGAGVATFLFPLAGANGAVWLRLTLSGLIMAVLWPPARLPWASLLRRGPAALEWSRRAWLTVAVYGAVLAAMNWCFYEAISRIPLGVAVAIEFIGPLGLSILLSRRVLDVIWALVAAAGLVLLTLSRADSGSAELVGVAFAAVAGVLWGTYILVSQRLGGLVPGTKGLSVALVLGAVLTVPAGLSAGSALLDWRILLIGAAVALLSSAIPYGVELEALRRVPARLFGILMSLEPAVAALIGVAALGQLLAAPEWAGIAAVCLASLGAAAATRRAG